MTRRGDLTAALAVLVFLAELAFAQVTLALAICFMIVGRVSRWRPVWLAGPLAVGLAWLLAIGVRPGAGGYLAVGGQMVKLLSRPGPLSARIADVREAFAGWRTWLPRQLPIALIMAAAQAAIATLPGLATRRWQYRRGFVIAAKNRYLVATLRRGELATAHGCCLGVIEQTGSRAEISWPEAEAGVLCTGQDASAVLATGLDLAIGAIQHRKTVIIIDLVGGLGVGGAGIGGVGVGGVGIGGPRVDDPVGSACASAGAPLRRLGQHGASYDPCSEAAPARATSLTMAMIDWAGVGHAQQHFCANYLNVAFALLAAANVQRVGGGRPVIDELSRLMTPAALRARFAQLSGQHPSIASLAGRVAELSMQLEADRSLLAPLTAQFAEFSSKAPDRPVFDRPVFDRPVFDRPVFDRPVFDRPLDRPVLDHSGRTRPPLGSINLTRALADREVVHFPLDRRARGRPAVMTARLAVADLIEVLAERGDLGDRADCMVWINGCEGLEYRQLAVLVALGERTGTAVVLGTADSSAAAALSADVNVVAVRGVCPPDLGKRPAVRVGREPGGDGIGDGLGGGRVDGIGAGEFGIGAGEMAAALAEFHTPGCHDALSILVRRPSARLVAGCRAAR